MTPDIMQYIQNIGAMGLLGLLVWKIPDGVRAIKALMDGIVEKVQKAHTDAITGNQQDFARFLQMVNDQQAATIEAVRENTNVMRHVVEQVTVLVNLHGIRAPVQILTSDTGSHAKLAEPTSGRHPVAG